VGSHSLLSLGARAIKDLTMKLAHGRTWQKLAVGILVTPLAVGCESQAQIRTYPVKKEHATPAASAPQVAASSEATDRMMGAILPAEDRTWYFKITGPVAAMDKNAEALTAFFQTIRVPAGAEKPQWKTPEGWNEQPGTGMRAATLMVPSDDKPLELSVIALPTSGAPGELLSNVNRWRGQMKLPPVDAKGLSESVQETKAGDARMYVVDLRGQLAPSTMTAPFAGGGPFSGGAPRGPVTAESRRNELLPAGHPPLNPHGTGGDSPLTFKAPKSWPESTPDGLRKAMFAFQDGGREARVTAIDFPAAAGPKIADPLENMNRWRREVGLSELKKEDLDKAVQSMEIAGQMGHYAEMVPDAPKPGEPPRIATIAAMVSAGDVIWFFKLTGDRDLVLRERENFNAFLKSVRLAPADRADDGN
jgi:hypothetical protein